MGTEIKFNPTGNNCFTSEISELSEETLKELGFVREKDEPFYWSDNKPYWNDCFFMAYYSDGLHEVFMGHKYGIPLKSIDDLKNRYYSKTGITLPLNP